MSRTRTALPKLLDQAREAATPAPPRKVPPQHKGLELPAAELAAVAEMIGLGVVVKEAGKRHDQVKARAKTALFHAFTAEFWKRKKKPENPRIVIPDPAGEPDHDTLYQLRDQFSLSSFADSDAIIDALTAPPPEGTKASALDAPLSHDKAVGLVAREITSSPTLRLRYTLTELAEGHYEDDPGGSARFVEATKAETTIADKLLRYILASHTTGTGKVTLAPLTEAERAHLLVLDPRLTFADPKGFISRACDYVTSLPQLRRLLATFRPVQIFSGSHFALTASDTDRRARLVLVAAAVIDGSSPRSQTSCP